MSTAAPSISGVSSRFAWDGHDSEDGDEESYWGGGDSGGESRAGGGFGWVNAAGQEQLRDFQAPRVAMWAAVPGSKISEELYPM